MQYMPKRIGRITVALGLVVLGTALLSDNLYATEWLPLIGRLWPLLLIALGLEYLVFATFIERSGAPAGTYRFDGAGVVLLLLILFAVQVAGFTRFLYDEWETARVPLWAMVAGRETAEAARDDAFPLAPEARRLVIRGDGCSVTVRGTAGPGGLTARTRISVMAPTAEVAEQAARSAAPVYTGGAYPELGMRLPVREGPGNWHVRCELEVAVPARLGVELADGGGSAVLESLDGLVQVRSGGSVAARNLGGELRVQAQWGQVEIEDVAGPVDIRTSHGTVRAARFGGGRIETAGGEVLLEDWTGPLRVQNQQGSILARLAAPPTAETELRTGVGRVDLVLPAASSAVIDAQTGTGVVRVAGPGPDGSSTEPPAVGSGGVTPDEAPAAEPAGPAEGGGPAPAPAAPAPASPAPPVRQVAPGGREVITLGSGGVRIFLRTETGNIDIDIR